jgi:hypothetical protein
MPIDDGLICEIDETEQSFSLRKWILLPLLIIVTIICGYFALPTTKTVAVSVPKIVVTGKFWISYNKEFDRLTNLYVAT